MWSDDETETRTLERRCLHSGPLAPHFLWFSDTIPVMGHGRSAGTAASAPGGVHFEETVKKSPGEMGVGYWAGMVLFVAILGLLFRFGLGDGPVWLLVAGVGGVVLLGVMLYSTFGQGVRLRVTDAGVEVRPYGVRIGDATPVQVPFEAIESVEYNEPDGPFMYVRNDDVPEAESYMVERGHPGAHNEAGSEKAANYYWTGVRIGRNDGPPLYVATGRPVELAETVAARAPTVERATVIELSEHAY